MPIEIKELHIRVTVDATPGGQPAAPRSGSAPRGGTGDSAATKEALVAECVEQVLQILNNKMER